MNKVALTLEHPDVPATVLERILESLRPILALLTNAEVHVIVQEEE